MRKDKSYMNRKNLLAEGFFEVLRKYLIRYPKLKKDKKVTWDQEHLNFLFGDLEVSEYITTKYSVTEKNYNNASLIVKDKLDGGRTVIANDPSFTIEER